MVSSNSLHYLIKQYPCQALTRRSACSLTRAIYRTAVTFSAAIRLLAIYVRQSFSIGRDIVSDFPALRIWTIDDNSRRMISSRRARLATSRGRASKNFTKSGFHRVSRRALCSCRYYARFKLRFTIPLVSLFGSRRCATSNRRYAHLSSTNNDRPRCFFERQPLTFSCGPFNLYRFLLHVVEPLPSRAI